MSLNQKSAHTGIPLEDIVIGRQYSISFNPESQPQTNQQKDIFIWLGKWYDIFHKVKDYLEVSLNIECSPTGRYHFHGYIVIKDIHIYIMVIRMMKLVTTYEIDTITDIEKWKSYCYKQHHIWCPFFERNAIGYPLDNLKDAYNIITPHNSLCEICRQR